MLAGSRPVFRALFAALTLTVGLPSITGAQARVFTTLGQEHGLGAPPVWAIAQDSIGFIWIGAEGGLFRFDGTELRRWASDTLSTFVMDVAVSPDGEVVALEGRGRLYRVEGRRARRIELPGAPRAAPRRSGRTIAFDTSGTLWMLDGDSVRARGPAGAWRSFGPGAFDGEAPRGVLPTDFGGAFLTTDSGLWRIRSDRAPRRIFSTDRSRNEVAVGAVEPEPGRVLVLSNVTAAHAPRVVEVEDGERQVVVPPGELPRSRAIFIRERNGTIWLALDVYLVAVPPGGRPELLGSEEGFESGGPLLIDREGSLWLGSFVGLHRYPEPDTRIWAEREGIPSRHTRFVARTRSTLWVMTWSGPASIRRSVRGWEVVPTSWDSRSNICTTHDGRAWTGSDEDVLELLGDSVAAWPGLEVPIHGCAAGRHGGVWLGSRSQVTYLDPDRGTRVVLDPPRPDEVRDPRPVLLHDQRDRLWVGAGELVCQAPASRLLDGEAGLWRCKPVATRHGIFQMVELEDGRIWAAAGPAGLIEHDSGRWSSLKLPNASSQTVQSVVPSPRGGVWVVGEGMLARARPGVDGDIRVLEQLTRWHGLPAQSGSDLLEEEDGDLWLATNRGLARVPASVRFADPSLPPVTLVEARVDGRPVPTDKPLVLPHDRNRLELRFAALSFRYREGLSQQIRLSPDEPWSEASGEPTFRWVDLPPGTYEPEYRVSRDGDLWSPVPAGFTFEVEPPWYAAPWFLFVLGLTAVGLAAAVHRARVGYLLGLEQQRTRIAMDLHDQVGSGLATVGVLSGIMANEDLEPGERERTAQEIAEVAEELGHSLSDIVWTLDPRTSSMEELVTRLAEHGERLFPDEETLFEVRLPNRFPGMDSSVAVRRNVLLIGLEALHNAARHADASHIVLSLRPRRRGAWELSVRDDGTGIHRPHESSPPPGGGRGLEAMRRRAEDIGAHLEIHSGRNRGTTVRLRFHPWSGKSPAPWRRALVRVRSLAHMIMRTRREP